MPSTTPQDPDKEVTYKFSECREAFADPQVGGLAISLPHGSVVFECARHEVHATTALKEPSRVNPTRIGKSNQLYCFVIHLL